MGHSETMNALHPVPLLHRPRLVIFDMDGLLFNTEQVMMEVNAKVMDAHGYRQIPEYYRESMGTAGETFARLTYEQYGADYPLEQISEESFRGERDWLRQHGVPVKPGIPELLQYLRDSGVPCCMATSTEREYALDYLRMAGLDSFFQFVLGGNDVTRSKPDPEVHLRACARAGVRPEEALVLEDSGNGVRAAYNAGVPVICIPDLAPPDEDTAARASAVAPDAWEVIRILRALEHAPEAPSGPHSAG